jgi:hypothetical protein
MLADGLLRVNVPVAGLVTLGTPHVGYPYLAGLDEQVQCGIQVQEMAGRLWYGNPLLESGTMSPFLTELYSAWNLSQVGYRWLAAGGAFCSERTRSYPSAVTGQVNGCRRENPLSDGVVCLDSATLTYPQTESRMVPTERFSDPEQRYMHWKGYRLGHRLECPVWDARSTLLESKRSLKDPPFDESLFKQIWRFLNAL